MSTHKRYDARRISIFKAKKLIDIAKKANADFVKFQSYIPDEIVTNDLLK